MLKRRNRGKRPPLKYNIFFVPEDESGKSRSLRVSLLGVLLSFVALFLVIVATVIVVLVYTPVGSVITIPNPYLEERYISELMQVQDRLNRVTEDVLFMREYNLQMRRALGEDDVPGDTSDLAATADSPERRQDLSPEVDRDDMDVYYSADDFGIMGFTSGPIRMSPSIESRFRPTLPISLPADGYITRRFDVHGGHVGIDIAGKVNTPIATVADGTVLFSGWTYHDGNMIIISHGGGYFSVYKHNQSNVVRQGAVVRRGETIALLGNTGKQSFGPHLHFELWRDGVPLDPAYYLFEMKESL